MLASTRRWAWRKAGVYVLLPPPGRNVGRAISPAAWGLRHCGAYGTMQASSPTKHGARALPGFAGYLRRKAAMHPSVCAFRRIHLPLQGRLCKRLPPKRLPCKGLRSRAPPAADTARRSRCSGRRTQVCFSTRSAMRAPQTGNVGVSRLRGAAPCPANTLPGRRRLPRSCGITELCGAALAQNRSITPPQTSPAGEIARPTMQGKRQAKPETLPLRPTFLFPAPICGEL